MFSHFRAFDAAFFILILDLFDNNILFYTPPDYLYCMQRFYIIFAKIILKKV